MNLLKIFLAVAVICCLVCSAGAISAEEVASDQADSSVSQADDSSGVEAQDDAGGWAGSNYEDSSQDTHEGAPEIDPDYSHMEPGSNTTDTANSTAENATAGNTTGNATGNATNQTAGNNTIADALHNLLATGNPIFILLILIAIVGGITVYRRK